jgi:hypothetical protein
MSGSATAVTSSTCSNPLRSGARTQPSALCPPYTMASQRRSSTNRSSAPVSARTRRSTKTLPPRTHTMSYWRVVRASFLSQVEDRDVESHLVQVVQARPSPTARTCASPVEGIRNEGRAVTAPGQSEQPPEMLVDRKRRTGKAARGSLSQSRQHERCLEPRCRWLSARPCHWRNVTGVKYDEFARALQRSTYGIGDPWVTQMRCVQQLRTLKWCSSRDE